MEIEAKKLETLNVAGVPGEQAIREAVLNNKWFILITLILAALS
jgi:hypothetical protein